MDLLSEKYNTRKNINEKNKFINVIAILIFNSYYSWKNLYGIDIVGIIT